jgi:hypothetical protein
MLPELDPEDPEPVSLPPVEPLLEPTSKVASEALSTAPEPLSEPVPASTPASAKVAHVGMEIALVSIVTAALRARARPLTVAPVVRAMFVSARMLPLNAVVVPRVAELPTCQKMLQSCAPPRTRTDELLAVVSVLPI